LNVQHFQQVNKLIAATAAAAKVPD